MRFNPWRVILALWITATLGLGVLVARDIHAANTDNVRALEEVYLLSSSTVEAFEVANVSIDTLIERLIEAEKRIAYQDVILEGIMRRMDMEDLE